MSKVSSHNDKAYYLSTEDGEELKQPFSVLRMAPWKERAASESENESIESLDEPSVGSDSDSDPPIKSKKMKTIRLIPKGKVTKVSFQPKAGALMVAFFEM